MINFREVNENDMLGDFFDIREEILFGVLNTEDRKHNFDFDKLSNNILRNVSKQNQKYVKKNSN